MWVAVLYSEAIGVYTSAHERGLTSCPHEGPGTDYILKRDNLVRLGSFWYVFFIFVPPREIKL
jgi:hypothetical protein